MDRPTAAGRSGRPVRRTSARRASGDRARCKNAKRFGDSTRSPNRDAALLAGPMESTGDEIRTGLMAANAQPCKGRLFVVR
jgi:hypothetical protein